MKLPKRLKKTFIFALIYALLATSAYIAIECRWWWLPVSALFATAGFLLIEIYSDFSSCFNRLPWERFRETEQTLKHTTMRETIVQGLKVLAIPFFVFGTLGWWFLLTAVALVVLFFVLPIWYACKRNAAPLDWAVRHANAYWDVPMDVFTKFNNYFDNYGDKNRT